MNSFKSALIYSDCKRCTITSSSPWPNRFILASLRKLFSRTDISRYHSSDLAQWRWNEKERRCHRSISTVLVFTMICYLAQRYCTPPLNQSLFLLCCFWTFSLFVKMLSARTLSLSLFHCLFCFTVLLLLLLFWFPSRKYWNPRLSSSPLHSSHSLLSVAAWMWKPISNRSWDISNSFPLQLANRTRVLAEAIWITLEVWNVILRDDLIQER